MPANDTKHEIQHVDAEIIQYDSGESLALQRAEIDIQIATAKQYPRDIEKVMENCLKDVTFSPEVAESVEYAIPREDKRSGTTKIISGESIRLAEIMKSRWGNIRTRTYARIVDKRWAEGVAQVHDLESNDASMGTAMRPIVDRNGRMFSADMQRVTLAAVQSLALRNAIFRVIPKAYAHQLMEAAKKVAQPKEHELPAARKRAIAAFEERGVKQNRLLKRLGRKSVEQITADDIVTLRGYMNAIRDDIASVDDLFGEDDQDRADRIAKELKAKNAPPAKASPTVAPPAEPKPEPEPTPQEKAAGDSMFENSEKRGPGAFD
jgi:hypothetical protein